MDPRLLCFLTLPDVIADRFAQGDNDVVYQGEDDRDVKQDGKYSVEAQVAEQNLHQPGVCF